MSYHHQQAFVDKGSLVPIAHRLRTKLFISFLILLLIPIIGTGLYAQFFFSSTYYNNAVDIEQRNVNSVAAQVRTTFVEVESDLIFLANTCAVNILLSNANDPLCPASLQMVQNELLTFLRTHPMYQSIAIYDNAAQVVLAVESTGEDAVIRPDYGVEAIPFVEQVLSQPVGSTHFGLENFADRASLEMLFAFRHSDGLLVGSVNIFWILMPETIDSDGGTWSLQLPNRVVLNFVPEEQDRLSPEIEENDDWQRNSEGYYEVDDRHIFYQNVAIPTIRDRYNLVLFHTVLSQQMQADLSLYYQTFATLTLGGVLCVIALSMLAIDRFLEPIRFLKDSMDTIRRTQKPPALPDRLPPDEIGELTLAFYAMSAELEAKRNAERALLEKLITAQEEERKRIAYELHDGLIQLLVGARFYLNEVKAICSDDLDFPAQEKFTEGYESLSTAIIEGRRIMQGLHPSTLDDLGLVDALEELGRNAARLGGWGIQLSLDLGEEDQQLDKIMNVTLYRIAQEALNNVCKHAEASRVTMKLWSDQGIHLVIADDGGGFDPALMRETNGGWGLRTMQERINLLHGTISIDSQFGTGTSIAIWIPQNKVSLKEK